MKIQIHEGSAARNFQNWRRFNEDHHVRRSVYLGFDLYYDVLRIASKNPVDHYNLLLGLLRKGDSVDFIVVDNLDDFNVL
jgi:adenine deaminase